MKTDSKIGNEIKREIGDKIVNLLNCYLTEELSNYDGLDRYVFSYGVTFGVLMCVIKTGIRQLELEGQAKKEFIEDIKKDFIRAANSLLDAKN